jgi:hypothetical protein
MSDQNIHRNERLIWVIFGSQCAPPVRLPFPTNGSKGLEKIESRGMPPAKEREGGRRFEDFKNRRGSIEGAKVALGSDTKNEGFKRSWTKSLGARELPGINTSANSSPWKNGTNSDRNSLVFPSSSVSPSPRSNSPISPNPTVYARNPKLSFPSSTSLPTGLARPISSPKVPTINKFQFVPQLPTATDSHPLPRKSTTLPSGISKLGGLSECPACGMKGTLSETVVGPRGNRWHEECLRCGGCGKKLDSGCRTVKDEGEGRSGREVGVCGECWRKK